MIKVATPVLYEQALDGLNRVRPLQLADSHRLSLNYPMLCKNSVGVGNPVIGKLARCNEQGAILKKVFDGLNLEYVQSFILSAASDYVLCWLELNTKAVVFNVIPYHNLTSLKAIGADEVSTLLTMTISGNYFISYNRSVLFLQSAGSGDYNVTVNVYDFS